MSDDAQEMMLYIHQSALGAFQHLQRLMKQTANPELTTTQEFYCLNDAAIQAMPDALIMTSILLTDRNRTVAQRINDGQRIIPYLEDLISERESEAHTHDN
ncbi:hypothetical protein [Secundilactobacillus similis]|uniref:Uncharacterized protein n=1 Tax=Secundilactobacillus similis DSM 23365 = JCM 2765 TaxID=1423804 RepID=A0A0R2EJD2_9LACO|nr:hypothetical protein [Secundilactobacillus similis]KRN15510.1 hypothetical protein FD14_GL002849 [Secundilactobacillus similis DSM 23365 = JCM 2765]